MAFFGDLHILHDVYTKNKFGDWTLGLIHVI